MQFGRDGPSKFFRQLALANLVRGILWPFVRPLPLGHEQFVLGQLRVEQRRVQLLQHPLHGKNPREILRALDLPHLHFVGRQA